MVVYPNIILTTKGEMDEFGIVIVPPTEAQQNLDSIYTFVYSLVIILFGQLYKGIAIKQTNDENHRYQNKYDDALIRRLALFNCLNFFLPLMLIAFDQRNPRNFDDIFDLALSQMAYKQIAGNIIEYFTPIIKVKKKLDYIDGHFEDTINEMNGIPAQTQEVSEKSEESKESEESEHNKLEEALLHANIGEDDEKNKDSKDLSFRRYQAVKSFNLMPDSPNLLDNYMELALQFGYIALFSGVFPLASLLSLFSNGIQIKSQINNLKYMRRFDAEVSNGIGSWMVCLETLAQISIMFNCALVFFTSKVYYKIFV